METIENGVTIYAWPVPIIVNVKKLRKNWMQKESQLGKDGFKMYGIEKNVFGLVTVLNQDFTSKREAERYLCMLESTNKNKYIVYSLIEL
jgi:hypothetical protein